MHKNTVCATGPDAQKFEDRNAQERNQTHGKRIPAIFRHCCLLTCRALCRPMRFYAPQSKWTFAVAWTRSTAPFNEC